MYNQLFFTVFILIFSCTNLAGQGNYGVVKNLLVVGNHHTEEHVILREMDIFPGDTLYLDRLPQQILLNENRLLSTALFTDVTINLKNWDTDNKVFDVEVAVQENWYIYPSIIFELADRNFNVWWQEQNRSLDRVNYGLRLDHINLTGNRDRLKAKFQLGYTKKYELLYDYPYLNRNWGFTSSIFYSENKEIGYITRGNKTLFHKMEDERRMRSRFRVYSALNYRPDLFTYHSLSLQYHYNTIDQFVAEELNPDYFLNGAESLRFFILEYNLEHDKRIFWIYPLGGHLLFFNIKKEGLGIFGEYNNLPVYAGFEKYFNHKDWILGFRVKGKTNLIRDQVAFANNTALGYGPDVLTGFELYVLDGTDYFTWQTSLKHQVWDKNIDLGDNMPLRQFKRMSIRVFLRFSYDIGYVNERTYTSTNTLNNQWISGYGPAIDIVLWNTITLKAEYNFNELGEGGFFLQSGLVF